MPAKQTEETFDELQAVVLETEKAAAFFDIIPPITDPLGSSWRQPDASEILIDATNALMSEKTLRELAEYSMSQPTGVYPGKMWKSDRNVWKPEEGKCWVLCWYGNEFEEGGERFVSNNYREIIVCD